VRKSFCFYFAQVDVQVKGLLDFNGMNAELHTKIVVGPREKSLSPKR
jgi:hypothetical protein